MRRTTAVTLVQTKRSPYSHELGRAVLTDVQTVETAANVSDLKNEATLKSLGIVEQQALQVRIQGHIDFVPTHVIVGSVRYAVIWQRSAIRSTVYYAVEQKP